MRRAALSESRSALARAAASGLQALGWTVETAAHVAEADLRVEFVRDLVGPAFAPGQWGAVIFVSEAADRLSLSEMSVAIQKRAIAAAPGLRVNGVAVAKGWSGELAPMLDWLAGAQMVTGQTILLSNDAGPGIPF